MLIDISQPVTSTSACYPGDAPFSCGWTATMAAGASVNVGWMRSSPHVGTHVDAPFHFDPRGARIGGLSPDAFVGPALVVDAVGRPRLDAALLAGLDLHAAPRVLFRTQRTTDPDAFVDTFPVLTHDAVEILRAAGVRLVGVDVHSVDPADATDFPIHRALGAAGIVNVENLRLDEVAAGRYELLAAPVLWRDMDAAPLRALLRR